MCCASTTGAGTDGALLAADGKCHCGGLEMSGKSHEYVYCVKLPS
jgi:hypothetical protein